MAQADLSVWIFGRLPVFGQEADVSVVSHRGFALLRSLWAEAGNTLLGGEGAPHHDKRFRYFIRMFENR